MDQISENPVRLSVIIPVYNARATLGICLEAVTAAIQPGVECLLVDDGSSDGSLELAREYPVRVITGGAGPHGPAYARNRGVEAARGEIVFFIDSDVLVYPDTFDLVMGTFTKFPHYDAVFGSYDESPGERDFLSQYKNLLHGFVHQQANEDSHTFWSGCGAVRRSVFIEQGGFDEKRYPRPSIEDIDLGCRMRLAGHRILLNKNLRVKHLKRWTLSGLLKTDFRDRAIPWTMLILRDRSLPNDLNLSQSQRLSALLSLGLAGLLGFSLLDPSGWLLVTWALLFVFFVSLWSWMGRRELLPIRPGKIGNGLAISAIALLFAFVDQSRVMAAGAATLFVGLLLLPLFARRPGALQMAVYGLLLGLIGVMTAYQLVQMPVYLTVAILGISAVIGIINVRLYRFFFERRGPVFSLAAYPLQLLYYLYSLLAFGIGLALHTWRSAFRPKIETMRDG